MGAGIVLVHGYSGSPDAFLPLAQALSAAHGSNAVTIVCLPGHGGGRTPVFDQAAFIATIADAIQQYQRDGRTVIVLGHSTGGILALAALKGLAEAPRLLILASVPKRIDPAYLERWGRHRTGKGDIPFASVANMVSLINAVGSKQAQGTFPVLVLHGSKDDLVPLREAVRWEQCGFEGPVRSVAIPEAGHELFEGPNKELAVDIVARAVADLLGPVTGEDEQMLTALSMVEPEAERFFLRSPLSRRHVARCPSGYSTGGRPATLSPVVGTEPVFANIEITTRCNLRCTYCARTRSGPQGTDMPAETFFSILGLLPHAYRVTLVGLGETLLHPSVVDLVAGASQQGRRVALVTNAMLLDRSLSRELLKAGLESIAFSIDGPNQDAASDVRPGTDLARVIDNIRTFVEQSKATRGISTAVFAAVSLATAPYLEDLVDLAAGLGVHVLMLSDLNYKENREQALWKNIDDAAAFQIRNGVARAFQKNLPVLSVRGLEEFGLWKRYGKFLLLPPEQLYQRSAKHAWCYSPWQTVPVGVAGEVTLCDCQPGVSVGNILDRPLAAVWNSEVMIEHRRRMLGPDPPEACRVCPRF
jgi:MoaA/NifB/PqqE/SkfB family radical SAM enzyme/alpha-beta hydrolase superfamily lysophospholipase